MKMSSSLSATKSSSIHWAIIGLGDVCTIKSGPAFYKCHHSNLVAVMRRTPGAARQWVADNRNVIQQYNSDGEVEIRGYDNVHEMICENRDVLDAVYIATPPSAHLENVRQILSALDTSTTTSTATTTSTTTTNSKQPSRLKAIYMEKPCGRSAWETRTIIEELYHRHIQFIPAYVSRAHERTQVLIDLLQSQKVIGERVQRVQYTQCGSSFARGLDGTNGVPWRLRAECSGGGLVMDMGCHVLDRVDYLFGPVVDVRSAVLRKGGGGDVGGGETESGYPLVEDYIEMKGRIGKSDWAVIPSEDAVVECLWDFSPPDQTSGKKKKEEVDELIITGTNGSLRMAGMGAGMPIEVLDANGNVIKTIEFEAPLHAAQPLIQSIVNELHGVDSDEKYLVKSPARAENAIRTSEVLDAILNSYYGGRHDEFWTRPESWPGLK